MSAGRLAAIAGALAVVSLGFVWSYQPGYSMPSFCTTDFDGGLNCTYGWWTLGSTTSGFGAPARVFVAAVVVLVAVAGRSLTASRAFATAGGLAIAGATIAGSSWGPGHTLLSVAGLLLVVAARREALAVV